MKNILLGLLALGGLVACKKEVVTGQTEVFLNRPFELAYKQTTTLPAIAGGPVGITLTDVADSRCPSNAECIWQGYVAVAVELTDATNTPQTARIALHFNDLPGYAADSAAVTLNQRAYWLRLLNVTPYPSTASNGQTKTATLRLRPR